MKCRPAAVFYVWAGFRRLVWVIGCLRLMLGREQMETLKSTAWIQSVSLHEISPGETFSLFLCSLRRLVYERLQFLLKGL